MRYYILKKGVEYVIYKVNDNDILPFEERYHDEILLQADSLMQLLLLFEREMMFSIHYSSEKEAGNAGEQPAKR